MKNHKQILAKLEEEIIKQIPGYERKIKEDSKLMKFLNFFAKIFNPYFLSSYITTFYPKVYFPKNITIYNIWEILSHEFVHLFRAKKQVPIVHGILYMFPQCLAFLSLLSLAAIWFSNWWLLSLLFLILLAPLPAYFRTQEERAAYRMTLAIKLWTTKQITDDKIDWVAKHFYSSSYYFMWPFKDNIIKQLEQDRLDLINGKYDDVYPYNFIKQIIEQNQ